MYMLVYMGWLVRECSWAWPGTPDGTLDVPKRVRSGCATKGMRGRGEVAPRGSGSEESQATEQALCLNSVSRT